ncbi:unnamed protein product [Schistocephalus solidus]|uniref:Uncharacterized protein n=1 Tax=Schistocephalus solidus TaxID=70667 RepID=A0A183TTJ7_SCHSO|nr:unnamed protein product [Schistocephalus solidus]
MTSRSPIVCFDFVLARESAKRESAGDREPNCWVIITPTSKMDDEMTAINDSEVDDQAAIASITTSSGDRESR